MIFRRLLGPVAAMCSAFIFSPAAGASPARPSPEAVAFANDLLGRMTLDEKIGQLVLFTSHWTTTGPAADQGELEDQIRRGDCGNVFNAQTVAYIRHLQELAVNATRLHIPLLFGYDVIHGYKTVFPIPLAEAASWDLDRIENAARVAAREASAAGINWTYAPMVDIARDPRWGRIAEGSGEDPVLGCAIARARVRGFQGKNFDDASTVMACVKHFAGYGAAQAGRDYNMVDMSERTLREDYLPPFEAAVDEGAWSIMAAFSDLNGVPCTVSRFLLQHVLRDQWKFQGFVVTDYTAVHELLNHGVVADDAGAARGALLAGVDMDMQSGAFLAHLKAEVAAGRVKVDAIDTAARRILEAKYMLGLFKDPYRFLDADRERTATATPEHRAAAADMARRSIVLLKNERHALPLKPGAKIAVIGPLADDQPNLLGCWKGAGSSAGMQTILGAIRAANAGGTVAYARGCGISSTDASGFKAAVAAAAQADVVVMVVGESAEMTGEAASRTNIGLPGRQTELLGLIRKSGKPVVTVLLSGRPLALEEETNLSDALLETWFPGSSGGGPIADVLFGKFNPCGHLPATFPRNVGQVPIYYSIENTGRPFDPTHPNEKYKSTYLDCANDPLFPFGFGLSYTTFTISEPKLDRSRIKSGETLNVSVHVTNSGPRDGAEVVQLYIRQLVASVARPVRELKAFHRIELKAGESTDVTFPLTDAQLKFWRPDATFGTEPGPFRVFVGPNSRDVKSASFQLE